MVFVSFTLMHTPLNIQKNISYENCSVYWVSEFEKEKMSTLFYHHKYFPILKDH